MLLQWNGEGKVPLNMLYRNMAILNYNIIVIRIEPNVTVYVMVSSLTKIFLEIFERVRPLQFNYLSYKLFLEKKSCQTPKKKEKKSHLWCLTDESGFEIFCQTPKKKKKCKF